MPVISEWHNSLKLGYDVQGLGYGTWVAKLLRDNGIHVVRLNSMSDRQDFRRTAISLHH